MAAVGHLGFLKVRNSNCRYSSEDKYASPNNNNKKKNEHISIAQSKNFSYALA